MRSLTRNSYGTKAVLLGEYCRCQVTDETWYAPY
jgi:hypothetical protein